VSIVFGFIARENVMYGIIGEIADYDLQETIFLICLILGLVLIFMMLCTLCIAWKRYCCVQLIYTFLLTLFFIIYLVLGIVIAYVATYSADELEKLCTEDSGANNDFQKAMNELYSSADEIYCRSTLDACLCEPFSHSTVGGERVAPYETTGSGGISNVQGCSDNLQDAYADYDIDFNSVNEIVDYLDYFGDIEEEYSCSGICDYQSVYYFF